jgi:hypothetical protein
VREGWRKLHDEELHNLYSSPSIIRMKSRRVRWTGHLARMGEEKENAYRIFVGKPEGRPRRRWVDNTKMDLREIGRDGAECIGTSGGLL